MLNNAIVFAPNFGPSIQPQNSAVPADSFADLLTRLEQKLVVEPSSDAPASDIPPPAELGLIDHDTLAFGRAMTDGDSDSDTRQDPEPGTEEWPRDNVLPPEATPPSIDISPLGSLPIPVPASATDRLGIEIPYRDHSTTPGAEPCINPVSGLATASAGINSIPSPHARSDMDQTPTGPIAGAQPSWIEPPTPPSGHAVNNDPPLPSQDGLHGPQTRRDGTNPGVLAPSSQEGTPSPQQAMPPMAIVGLSKPDADRARPGRSATEPTSMEPPPSPASSNAGSQTGPLDTHPHTPTPDATGTAVAPHHGDLPIVSSAIPIRPATIASCAVETHPARQILSVLSRIQTPRDGGARLTIRLEPESLGQVDIRIDRAEDGPARVLIAVERPETLMLLRQDHAELREAFERAGLRVEPSELRLELVEARQTSSTELEARGEHHRQSGYQRWVDATRRDDGESETPDPPAAPTWRRTGLDITA